MSDKSEEFTQLYSLANPLPNARAKVPVLDVAQGTLVLCESIVIAEYLADEFGEGSIQPKSSADRARSRLFTELCSNAFSYFPILRVRDDVGKRATALENLKFSMAGVNDYLTQHGKDDGPFLFGRDFSTAECIAAPFVQRACVILPTFCGPEISPLAICDELKLSRLSTWIKAVLARPSVSATGVKEPDMVKSVEAMLTRFAAADNAPR